MLWKAIAVSPQIVGKAYKGSHADSAEINVSPEIIVETIDNEH